MVSSLRFWEWLGHYEERYNARVGRDDIVYHRAQVNRDMEQLIGAWWNVLTPLERTIVECTEFKL